MENYKVGDRVLKKELDGKIPVIIDGWGGTSGLIIAGLALVAATILLYFFS
jgi:hypothetical protein